MRTKFVLIINFILICSIDCRTQHSIAENETQESENNRIDSQTESSSSQQSGQHFVRNISLNLGYLQIPSKIEVNSSSCSHYDQGFCVKPQKELIPTSDSPDKPRITKVFKGVFFSPGYKKEDAISTVGLQVYGEPLCRSVTRVYEPTFFKNNENSWQYVVNGNNFEQLIRYEECIGQGHSCHMTSNFPQGYTTQCEQRKSRRMFLVVDEKTGELQQELFELPSHCECFVYLM